MAEDTKFKKGQSGNPKGKIPGTPTKRLTHNQLKSALAIGDGAALKVLSNSMDSPNAKVSYSAAMNWLKRSIEIRYADLPNPRKHNKFMLSNEDFRIELAEGDTKALNTLKRLMKSGTHTLEAAIKWLDFSMIFRFKDGKVEAEAQRISEEGNDLEEKDSTPVVSLVAVD